MARKQAKRRCHADLRSLEHLTFDPQNARVHTDRNLQMIQESMSTVGAARSIVIDEDGIVRAGEASVKAARALGLKLQIVDGDGKTLIAVRRSGLSKKQKALLALYDNRTAELADGWDADILTALQASGVSLDGLWNEKELAALLDVQPVEGLTDPDEVPAPRATSIKPGDLFTLGEQRLLCGDSTNPGDVFRLLGPDRPHLMVTDPPYGIEYNPAWRAQAGVNRNTKKLGTVANDDRADWTAAWELFPGDVAYVWHAGLRAAEVQHSLTRARFRLRSQIIWAKDRFALSRGDYHWQHEPCWYAVRESGKGHWAGDRSQATVWSIPSRDDAGHGHGTQKPVECMARPVRNNSQPGNLVYEPFAGSGTTLIACEQFSRRCRAIELEPTYCQIIIDRWEAFAGKKAVRVTTTTRSGTRKGRRG